MTLKIATFAVQARDYRLRLLRETAETICLKPRAPFKPEEQRAALANSIYRGIRTRMAVAVQRGIAVQILTFVLPSYYTIISSVSEKAHY